MPTPTYIPLATKTLTATATSVTFSSISQAYRDLVLVGVGNFAAADNFLIAFNGDVTAANYFAVAMSGTGTSAVSSTVSGQRYIINNYGLWDATTIANVTTNIMDYSATDKHKTLLSRANSTAYGTDAMAGRWASTAAINSVTLSRAAGGNIAIGSVFTLYGIASA